MSEFYNSFRFDSHQTPLPAVAPLAFKYGHIIRTARREPIAGKTMQRNQFVTFTSRVR